MRKEGMAVVKKRSRKKNFFSFKRTILVTEQEKREKRSFIIVSS